MANELAMLNDADSAELARLAGADPNAERNANRVPWLKVLSDDEDADGNPLPKGSLYLTDQEEPVYAKEGVRIRVLTQHYQFIEYDPDLNKTVNKSVMQTSMFNGDFIDRKGTTRCGRPQGKLSDDQKERYKNIKIFRELRCLVSYTGKTASGEERTVENVPALMLLKGSNFMPFEDEVVKNLPNGRRLYDFEIELSLERKKNGSVVYYVIHYKPNFTNPLPFDTDVVESLKHFISLVEAENEAIKQSHYAAMAERQTDDGVYDAIAADLEHDLDDEEVA